MHVDAYRASGREHRRVICLCDHYPFPHRRGSLLCEAGVMGREGFSYWSRDTPEHIAREMELFDAFVAQQTPEPSTEIAA
ncbi:MAG: hypothetical protein RLN67_08295 [Algiphilus sp.]